MDPQRGPQTTVEMVNMAEANRTKREESVKAHVHHVGGPPIPTSPFDMPEPSGKLEEGPPRSPPEIPPSPFIFDYSSQDLGVDPLKEAPGNQNIANNDLQVGGIPLSPYANGQVAYNPPAIARSPFDMPEIIDGERSNGSKPGEGLENIKPQVVVPVALPRSPFDIPMDDDG